MGHCSRATENTRTATVHVSHSGHAALLRQGEFSGKNHVKRVAYPIVRDLRDQAGESAGSGLNSVMVLVSAALASFRQECAHWAQRPQVLATPVRSRRSRMERAPSATAWAISRSVTAWQTQTYIGPRSRIWITTDSMVMRLIRNCKSTGLLCGLALRCQKLFMTGTCESNSSGQHSIGAESPASTCWCLPPRYPRCR